MQARFLIYISIWFGFKRKVIRVTLYIDSPSEILAALLVIGESNECVFTFDEIDRLLV